MVCQLSKCFFTILNVCNDVFEATVWVCCNPCPFPRDYLFKYWEICMKSKKMNKLIFYIISNLDFQENE